MSEFKAKIKQLSEQWLEPTLALFERVTTQTSPGGSSLPELCAYHMETGGKRLRALIPLAAAEALEQDPKSVLPFAAACEMLHNATLVHDDLQDGDRTRRGRDTVWVRYGEPRAINLGDAMFYYTLLLAQELSHPAELQMRVANRILKDTLRVIDGQEREFLLKEELTAGRRPAVADYITMVEGKTGGLFSLTLAGAAELCGQSPELVNACDRAGRDLGVLFQVQDDVLDLYGEKGRERRGSDIAEGKVSALAVHFINNAPAEEAKWLEELLQRDREAVTDADISRAIELFGVHASRDWALDEIRRRRQAAQDDAALSEVPALQALVGAIGGVFVEPIEGLL